MSAGLVVFGSFAVLLFLGVPIALSLGMASVITLLYENLPLSIIPANLYSSTGKFVLHTGRKYHGEEWNLFPLD